MKLMHKNFNLLDLGNIIAVELFCVLKNIKSASRFNIKIKDFPKFKKICEQIGLRC